MNLLRQTIGILALAIASAGPLPLWLHHVLYHHVLCHDILCHAHAGHTHQPHVHVGQPEVGHTHASDAQYGHSHDCPPSDQRGLTVGSAEHECFVCYQLSQLSVPAVAHVQPSHWLPPTPANTCFEQVLRATQCGLYAPRGPPLG